PALMCTDEAFYVDLAAGGETDWLEHEARHFGTDHAALGAALLRRWELPERLCDAVATHHQPPTGDEHDALPLKACVFLSALLPHAHQRPGAWQCEWRRALHGQLLAPHYPDVKAFLNATDEAAQ